MAAFDPEHLRLTDFLDLSILQEIQDSFAAVANVSASITDADGLVLTDPRPTQSFLDKQKAIAAAEDMAQAAAIDEASLEPSEYVAPIMVNNQRLGSVRMRGNGRATADEAKITALAHAAGLDQPLVRSLLQQLDAQQNGGRGSKPAAIQFLFLLANSIARLCFQEFQLRQRMAELTAVYQVTMMLADARDLNKVLQRTVEVVCELMGVRASSIRLIDRDRDELVIRAVHNLSPQYLAKGPVRLSRAEIDRVALSSKGYEYVRRMSEDDRVQYRQESVDEGIVSMLSVGMRYKGRAIGALRIYTDVERTFTPLQIDLLKAVAAQASAAIENARLIAESIEAEQLEEQVRMARDVQQRMMPHEPPQVAGFDFASLYVPCFTLGGDFYDFIPLPGDNIGLVIADVSGKGVPASLIMAGVRAALRAHVDNLYYLYEVIRRINLMLYRDTQTSEFVTLLYGVLDTRNRRLTYCNAGHPPGLLLRHGRLIELSSDNLVLGVDPDEPYQQTLIDLKPGDTLLLYTDGLTDATNFEGQYYGRKRLIDAFVQGGATAEIVANNLLWDMRKFAGMSRRTDDVTLMVVKVD